MVSVYFLLYERRIQNLLTNLEAVYLTSIYVRCHEEVSTLAGSISCSVQTNSNDIDDFRLNHAGGITDIDIEGNVAKRLIVVRIVVVLARLDICGPLGKTDGSIAKRTGTRALIHLVQNLVFFCAILLIGLCSAVRIHQIAIKLRMDIERDRLIRIGNR